MSALAIFQPFFFENLKLSNSEAEKMTWDYRIVFTPYEDDSDAGEYTIREVYYDSEGEVSWYSDEGVEFVHTDFWELADDFDAVAEAFDKPVLILVDGDLVEDEEEDEEEE